MFFFAVIDKWSVLTASERCYLVGKMALGVSAVMFMLNGPGKLASVSWIAAIPLLFFMIGFVAWIIPKLIALGKSRIGTFPLVCLHALLLPVCVGLTRQYVGVALQLPPQSFDATVALVSILLVPALWAMLAAVTLLAGFFLSMLIQMGGIPIRSLLSILASVSQEGWPSRTLQRFNTFQQKIVDHVMGSLVAALFLLAMSGAYARVALDSGFIRLVAHGLDFSYAKAYPGVDADRRMRLLDNGLVAYAEREGLKVLFEVRRVAQCEETTAEDGLQGFH